MTCVYNLRNGEQLYYMLPPERAVVCAFNQDRGRNNTWTYDFSIYKKSKSGKTVFCGDFTALTGTAKCARLKA